jgi:MFS family permease
MGGMNIMMLYSEFRFGWGNQESGIFLSTVNIFRTLATVVVLPLIIHITRRSFNSSHQLSGLNTHSAHSHSSSEQSAGHLESLDIFLLRASIISDTISYIGYAISPTGALFTLSGVVAGLGAIGLATSEASMTKLLPASQTGELLGALGFLQGLARIVAPTVASLTYSWTAESMPQLVFWGIAMCFAAAGALTWAMKVDRRQGWEKGEGEEEGQNMAPLQADKLYDGP